MPRKSDAIANPTQGYSRSFTLTTVRVVATLGADGGALVETPDVLELHEGRLAAHPSPDNEQPDISTLEYGLSFGPPLTTEINASVWDYGRIIITGQVRGQHMEIRGDGWIGYSDTGDIEGMYDQPPAILIGIAKSDIKDFPGLANPNPPQQYHGAVYRYERMIGPRDDDWPKPEKVE